MSIKKLFYNNVSGIEVSGIKLPTPESGDPDDFVCPNCLVDTQKDIIAEVIQFGMIDDKHTVAIECGKCKTHYVIEYRLEHWAYGYIPLILPSKSNE